MNFTRIHIEANNEEQEILISRLSDLEAIGFEQGEDFLLAYFQEDDFKSYEVNELLHGKNFVITTVAEKNWNQEWESNFQPVTVEGFCGIRAHFHPPFNDVQHDILITPKMSFGTGHHATTYMMIKHMQDIDFNGKTVLDFGTGTGVLAILAEKLGASEVIAIDNDEWSIKNAEENLSKNECKKIVLELTETIPEQKYDVILANINRNILLQYMTTLRSLLKENGSLLLSGLLKADETIIEDAAHAAGLNKRKQLERDNWIALLFKTEARQ